MVTLLGVLMWILVALMLLGALIVLVVAMIGAGEMMKGQTGGLGAGGLIGIAIAYALLSLIYIYPTLKLWKYGTFIGRLSTSRSADDLIAALNQQRAFWKFAGIMAILMIVFYIVMIVGMGVYGATAASALQGMGTDLPLPE